MIQLLFIAMQGKTGKHLCHSYIIPKAVDISFSRVVRCISVTLATLEPQGGAELSPGIMVVAVAPSSASSPQSEAVTNELQELTLQPISNDIPVRDRKNVLQLKLQQRRTREELVSQGIMPPLKSPAAFHEQRRSLERARTEDYLKRKIRSRPERSELVRMHILEETSAEPSLQAKQLQLKRARLADDLNDKISHRPGPIELIHKNILPVDLDCPLQHSLLDSPKGAGESSLDEDSSDAFSPDTLANHDSPLGAVSQLSPSDMLTQNGDMSPSQFLTQVPPPPPPPPLLLNDHDSFQRQKLTNGTVTPVASRPVSGQTKSKPSLERLSQRPKKSKDVKPKVKKLKYHQYIPPDQKADREPPPQLDSTYAKILHQQQLFLQLQILNQQQQQHYNYHTILPAPPKPPAEQPTSTHPGPSPSRSVPPTTPAPSNQHGPSRQSQTPVGGAKPLTLPANLDDFKVAELKQELKLRSLTVSGTKMDLIERLRNYQEQNGGGGAGVTATVTPKPSLPTPQHASTQPAGFTISAPPHAGTNTLTHQSGEAGGKIPAFSLAQSAAPARIMRFGSTNSSPPVSPTPSERSLAVMSPDETSCNGDLFGEMVSSPLTQLSLHPSPASIKEENQGHLPTCSLSQSRLSPTAPQPATPPQEPSGAPGAAMEASPLDKDQLLQEKDKQIEELTRMLRQKQRLVETLRSQLEHGKQTGLKEMQGVVINGYAQEAQTKTTSIRASTILYPTLTNGEMVRVKKEVETQEEMEGLDEAQPKGQPQPTQCSQQTLLKLQQIHRIQVQQQTQQLLQTQQQQSQQLQQQKQQQQTQQMQQQKTSAQMLLQQQQQLQQLIIQQTQQKQLQLQHKQLLAQQRKQQRQAQRQQQNKQLSQTVTTQQVTPVFIGQQNGMQVPAQTFSLDLLKSGTTPTLVTDGNGNHYLIALTNHNAEGQNGMTSLGKTSGSQRITLQRLQSTPGKLPSQSPAEILSSDTQSKQQLQPGPVNQPIKKEQKAVLHLETNGMTNGVTEPSQSVSAPPNLHPFFDEVSNSSESPSTASPFLKENGLSSQQMDDLFDILLKSGEISGFRADPSLALLHSNPPTPPSSPLHLSPPTPPPEPSLPALPSQLPLPCPGSSRLEDFLESTTGTPLLGVEPDGGLTLIDDLHSQMLSTSSILDHPPSPMDMDTSDLGFSPHPAGLDFGDPALDSMDWLDISMGGGGGTSLAPLGPHTLPSVFSVDFLDSSDLTLHWDSCL
ncbi:myocardin-related transcription factor A-like isoform X2 [Oncorhynchus keta]|uniref:myocardin-related transcription factor A-like isoform X2 n=1 Tax=Oncorhynchus keta TaxID=8018 RepID=UPI0015F9FF6A|nr:myocardin-related transcription factor A-like isoform X2 [Oncorhynchus keta]